MKKAELKAIIKECIVEEGLVQEDSALREQRMMKSLKKGAEKYKYDGLTGIDATMKFMNDQIPGWADDFDYDDEFLEQLLYDDEGPAFDLANKLMNLGSY